MDIKQLIDELITSQTKLANIYSDS